MGIGKVLLYLAGLTLWLVVGGFLTLGPYIAHNIENAVGYFALRSATVAWLALPVTSLVALAYPGKVTVRMLALNVVLWLGFLGHLYFTWSRAYT